MRTIEYASQFKRDYKKAKRNPQYRRIDSCLAPALEDLASDRSLEGPPLRDHPLSGRWSGYRELHVRPDLLLIYAKTDAETLRLFRLGSHSEVFG
ncbi:type II toxin-antitoxin system RelE/ParE family toxin [Algiphilus aromaticivorans]|uniref:type II toxin-antitoxin system RelE/ParE family toxin n=1 Tax=Algiphilus aromaticivorans TaxID=382454 RepID=UPI0005C143B7|nr:type II toxin-antitoxin system YafQ family toxin [Algiphilus aromaticivorans]